MPVWRVCDVTTEPELSISVWQILETPSGTRHFVGEEVRSGTGRVSTAIRQFDPKTLRGVTSSGRVYQLLGPRGCSGDAQYVWSRWCRLNGVTAHTDVTDELFAQDKS